MECIHVLLLGSWILHGMFFTFWLEKILIDCSCDLWSMWYYLMRQKQSTWAWGRVGATWRVRGSNSLAVLALCNWCLCGYWPETHKLSQVSVGCVEKWAELMMSLILNANWSLLASDNGVLFLLLYINSILQYFVWVSYLPSAWSRVVGGPTCQRFFWGPWRPWYTCISTY